MHLAGEMFYYSICNANETVLNSFLEKIKDEILAWRESTNQGELPSELRNKKGNQILKAAAYPESAFYCSHIPSNISKENIYPYLVAFQAVRIAGLLHDVGHLPYSHILEKALKNLYECVGVNILVR